MKSMKITATNTPGRILLLLRPGKMDSAQLKEAFPTSGGWLYKMNTAGLIQINDDFVWSITDMGRAACPNRRDAKMEPLHACETSKSRAHGWPSTRQQQGASA